MDKSKVVATKNAYALLSKRRFEMAAAFFMLGGRIAEAARVCASNLGDWLLGWLVLRLMAPHDQVVQKQYLADVVMKEHGASDPHMASIVHWLSGDVKLAVSALVPIAADADGTTEVDQKGGAGSRGGGPGGQQPQCYPWRLCSSDAGPQRSRARWSV